MTLRTKPESLLEGLLVSFERALHTPEGTVPPAAILWTDQDGVWRPVVSRLRSELSHLFTLGEYDGQTRTGPTIWLKCIVGRTLTESPPPDVTPILYLPGVSRQELRAGGDCRPAYQPLVELLFRGRAWHQENGKDWSVEAFLVADEGLGLEVDGVVSALSNSRTMACIQAGNVPMPARRSSRSAFPCRRSFRMTESCARIRSRSVGRVSLSHRSACTIRIAGRPAQYSLLGAVCLNSITRLSRWIERRRASV